jgi:hypothetical protein
MHLKVIVKKENNKYILVKDPFYQIFNLKDKKSFENLEMFPGKEFFDQ